MAFRREISRMLSPEVIQYCRTLGIPYEHHIERLEQYRTLLNTYGPLSPEVKAWERKSANESRKLMDDFRAQIALQKQSLQKQSLKKQSPKKRKK